MVTIHATTTNRATRYASAEHIFILHLVHVTELVGQMQQQVAENKQTIQQLQRQADHMLKEAYVENRFSDNNRWIKYEQLEECVVDESNNQVCFKLLPQSVAEGLKELDINSNHQSALAQGVLRAVEVAKHAREAKTEQSTSYITTFTT